MVADTLASPSTELVSNGMALRVGHSIYRPFVIAGILTVLTAGCTLGAIALVGLSMRGSYVASVWTPYVLAHANSQLYGWVGFFIIGFSLQNQVVSPERKRLFHRLSVASLVLMALGIGLRFVADPLASAYSGPWIMVGCGSALLQCSAVSIFVLNLHVTRAHQENSRSWPGLFITASLIWWLLVSVAEPIAFSQSHQPNELGILFVAEWFSPLRDAQFLGFVSNMIFGVALIKLSRQIGVRAPTSEFGKVAFVAWNIGVVMRMLGWVLYFRSGMAEASIRTYSLSATFIAGGALFFVVASRMFEHTEEKLPSHKFIRAAFVWLLVGGLLMMLEPIHLRQIGAPFSHAYIGGIRHALTVGFISQMILGVGAHSISRFNQVPDSAQRAFWLTFMLLNVGNAARVIFEIATDYTVSAFAPMSITGFVELVGMAIWGATMLTVMRKGLGLRISGI